ncbi:hypothetical protein Tco_0935259 [Tanacetum coccineum]
MTNTRNQEVDNTLKSHDRAITEIQTLLAALMKQQEQSSKQQEEILKAVRDKPPSQAAFPGADVEGWIYHCEHFFAMDETPDNVKLSAPSPKSPVNDYVKSISARFSNAMFEDPLEELASLNQTGTLHELNTTFDSLLNKVNLTETQAISLYLKALKPDIRGPVKMFKPRTLHEAYGLAKTQALNNENLEEKLNRGKWNGGNTKSYNNSKITPPTNATKLPLLPTPNQTNTTVTKPTGGPRRLSRKELENKRARGECFWCTEKFMPGHKCTRNQNQVYIIEMEDEDDLGADETETENEENEHQISIHALTGLPSYSTMRGGERKET